jgi:hypothetical protein
MDRSFPDVIGVERQVGTNHVRLTFSWDDGESARVVLDQTSLLSLIAQLHEKIELSPLAPIPLSRLRPGTPIQVQGTSVKRHPDGSLRIVKA